MGDYLTTQEAADLLRLKKNTLEIWRVQGRGPVFLKLGSRVLYEREAVEAFAALNRRKSTSEPLSNLQSQSVASLATNGGGR